MQGTEEEEGKEKDDKRGRKAHTKTLITLTVIRRQGKAGRIEEEQDKEENK